MPVRGASFIPSARRVRALDAASVMNHRSSAPGAGIFIILHNHPPVFLDGKIDYLNFNMKVLINYEYYLRIT